MADLPSGDNLKSFNWEIYDESRHPDDGLIWLSSDEEAPTLAQPVKSFKSVPFAPWVVCVPELMTSDCSAEEPCVIPDSTRNPSSDTDARLVPPNSSDGGSSTGILFGSLLANYKTSTPFNLTRRLFRVAALVSVLLIGSVLPSILGHLRPTRVKASPAVGGPSIATQSAGMSRPVRVLTVMAGRQETIKDISIRFVGRFDEDLFEEIRKLNPDLKDPDHLDDGQLIRIPLRAATPVN